VQRSGGKRVLSARKRSGSGKRVLSARKRSGSGKRVLSARKRSGSGKSTDVGHGGVITGCDALSFRSSIANPQGVAQSSPQSTFSFKICFNKMYPHL